MRQLLSFCALAVFSTPALAQVPVTVHPNQQFLIQSADPQLAENKKVVFDFWREVLQTRDMTLAPQYLAENYIQHNPRVPTGRQPFMDFFGRFEREPVRPEIDNLVTLIAEGDLVVLAFRAELPDPMSPERTYTTTWFDMFRVQDGLIVEHWDYGTLPED